MKQPEIVSLLVRKDERIAALEEENRKLKEALELIRDAYWTEDEPLEEQIEELKRMAANALIK